MKATSTQPSVAIIAARFDRFPENKKIIPSNPSPGNCIKTADSGRFTTPATAAVVIVNETGALVAPGVTVAGEKPQVAPAGSPVHANETAFENVPPAAATVSE
jgi:hypothetical protein